MDHEEKTRAQLTEELDVLRQQVADLRELRHRGTQPLGVDEILRKVVEGTATATGELFFQALVRNLAAVLQV